jgi:hypothetical protein
MEKRVSSKYLGDGRVVAGSQLCLMTVIRCLLIGDGSSSIRVIESADVGA